MVDLREQVEQALKTVMDPHMGVNLADMGMLRRIDVAENGEVEVGLIFPCIGCPAYDLIKADVCKNAGTVEGVKSVKVKIDWDEDWQKSDMADTARARAANHGYVI